MRISSRTCTAALFAIVLTLGPVVAAAETIAELDASDPSVDLAGNYLAGRSADRAKDIDAAARYYREALAADPENAGLMERVLLLGLAAGDVADSFELATELIGLDKGNPTARLTLAIRAIRDDDSTEALDHLSAIARADLATLTTGLITAWIQFGRTQVDSAVETIDGLRGPEWYAIFKDYHTAILLDAAGRTDDAVEAIERAYTGDTTALRVVEAYARIMANAGEREKALEALDTFSAQVPLHPTILALRNEILSGKIPAPLAATAKAGVAEALYGLGSAIGLDDGAELSAAYLRLALYLSPGDHLITVAIGDAFQGVEECGYAIKVYESVPATSSARRNADIQIGSCLQTLERYSDAADHLTRVVSANTTDVEAAIQLGNAFRADDRFVEAAEVYTKALAAGGSEPNEDWRIYYFRGVSLERSKQWEQAESDLRKALVLNPDQPQVLNYLGYSLVDQGLKLDEALEMIRKAVDARPNDGYIVDSLGWAYYRLGRYEEAVTALETAVQLRAEDPVINDHLGDAYWKVGRKREAMFQWAHARDLDPDPEELPKILAKLEGGLDAAVEESPPEEEKTASVIVGPGESLSDLALRLYGDANEYQRILDANRDTITDPDKIFPGMTLRAPPAN
jgi:tetratricopeptide (TPR) repeat protein